MLSKSVNLYALQESSPTEQDKMVCTKSSAYSLLTLIRPHRVVRLEY